MSDGFSNPIIGGGGTLVYPSIHSPGFQHLIQGWAINKDGSAEFNNLEIRGQFSGLDFVLNENGLFFYGQAAPALVQSAGGSNGNLVLPSNSTWFTSAFTATRAGDTILFITATYSTQANTGAVSAALNISGAALTRIAHISFNATGSNVFGWLDVWASYDTPGGDTEITVTMPAGLAGQSIAVCRDVLEFSGLGPSPSVDISVTANDVAGTGTSWAANDGTTTSANELWVGAVAGYDLTSGTAPSITGPGAPWTNEAEQSTQIGSFTSSIDLMAGYQAATSTGTLSYAGTFAAAQNWAALAISIKPSTSPGNSTLIAATAAVAGLDSDGNSFDQGFTGPITAFQPHSNPAVPETWHNIPLSGWTVASGFAALYRITADGDVELAGRITTTGTSTTVSTALPAGYYQTTYAFTEAGLIVAASGGITASQTPRIALSNTGVLSVSGITVNSGTTLILDGVVLPISSGTVS